MDVYIHAELDPEPGLEPFHPLRDPNMTHVRSADGTLPPVFSVNVYDVGYFDGSGKFILLFNLEKTKEENEKLLDFQFKTTSFVPLPSGFVRQSLWRKEKFQIWNDKKIVPAKIPTDYNESWDTPFFVKPSDLRKMSRKSLEYMCLFKVRSHITKGTAIIMMGQVKRYVDATEVFMTQQDYFEA